MVDTPMPPDGAVERTLHDEQRDLLIREEPLLLRIGDQQLLTMRTPGHDEELALGLLVTERVVSSADDVVSIERFGASAPGNVVMDKLGINVDHVVERARALLAE